MKKTLLLCLSVLSIFGLLSCNDEPICTEIFAMAAIRIHGLQPDNHFTVRGSTGDTIYRDLKLDDSLYLVLDDNYQPEIEESSDVFTFHGYLNDNLIAKEEFLISADRCHIRVVGGNRSIEIKK